MEVEPFLNHLTISSMENEVMNIKCLLLSHNSQSVTEAVLSLNQNLSKTTNDDYIQIIIQYDIIDFLIELLPSVNYSLVKMVLNCFQILCLNNKFFSKNYPSRTTITLLRNMRFLIKSNEDSVLIESLKLLTNIYLFMKESIVNVEHVFNVLHEILTSKTNYTVLKKTMNVFEAFIENKLNHDKLTESILNKTFAIYQASVNVLMANVYKCRVSIIMTLCHVSVISVKFSNKIVTHKNKEVLKFHEQVKMLAKDSLLNNCIPFVGSINYEDNDAINKMLFRFMNFITIMTENEMIQEELQLLIHEMIAQNALICTFSFLNTRTRTNFYEKKNVYREQCLTLLSTMIVELGEVKIKPKSWPPSKENFSKFLNENLKFVVTDAGSWFKHLEDKNIKRETKFAIIIASAFLHEKCNNLQEMAASDLEHIVNFVNDFGASTLISSCVLKNLWYIYAISYSKNLNPKNVPRLMTANMILQRLILKKKNIKEINTLHSAILFWAFKSPAMSSKLLSDLMIEWLCAASKEENYANILSNTVFENLRAAQVLLHIIATEDTMSCHHGAKILKRILSDEQTCEKNVLPRLLQIFVPRMLKAYSEECRIDKLDNMSQIFDIAMKIPTESYSTRTIEQCMCMEEIICSIGDTNSISSQFYLNFYTFMHHILNKDMAGNIMQSKHFVRNLMKSLTSNESHLSYTASKVLTTLCEIQVDIGIRIHQSIIVKLVCNENETFVLQHVKLFNLLMRSPTSMECDADMYVSMYVFCLEKAYRSCLDANVYYECAEKMLVLCKRSGGDTFKQICWHPSNHLMLEMFSDPLTKRSVPSSCLHLLTVLLESLRNETTWDPSLLSRTAWNKSLQILATKLLKSKENLDVVRQIAQKIAALPGALPLKIERRLRAAFTL